MNIFTIREEISKWEAKHPGSHIEYHMFHVGDKNPYPKDIYVSRIEESLHFYGATFDRMVIGIRCEKNVGSTRRLSRAYIFSANELSKPKLWPVQRFHATLSKIEKDCDWKV